MGMQYCCCLLSFQEHVLVPLLPPSMSDFLLAPFPFIMGFIWGDENYDKLRLEDDVVVSHLFSFEE